MPKRKSTTQVGSKEADKSKKKVAKKSVGGQVTSAQQRKNTMEKSQQPVIKNKPVDEVELTESQLKRMPKKSYMNAEQRAYFRSILLKMREEIEENIKNAKAELAMEWRESDENDIASLEEERAIKLRIIERESKLIPKIFYSLRQIEEGTYGYCEETGEAIGIERLLLRPTATLSIAAKAFHEQKEKEYSDG